MNFRLGEIIGLIHALEKRYYQNKTLLRYNFGSVYFVIKMLRLFCITVYDYEKTKNKNVYIMETSPCEDDLIKPALI